MFLPADVARRAAIIGQTPTEIVVPLLLATGIRPAGAAGMPG